MALTAIVRAVSPAIIGCELSFVERTPIDFDLACRQHESYALALSRLGCRVLELPLQPVMPDSVFVEDVAVVVDEVAVMTRPGAASRRRESESVAEVLAQYRPLLLIEAPGTLEGGDVLRVGRTLYVGQSARTNAAGIEQLRQLLAPHGYSVVAVAMKDCLHLKSAVTLVADDTVLINPAWLDADAFASFRVIETAAGEEHAANTLRIGDGLVYPDCFPQTLARLRQAGIKVNTVDVSELQKAEGAVTCCCLVFEAR